MPTRSLRHPSDSEEFIRQQTTVVHNVLGTGSKPLSLFLATEVAPLWSLTQRQLDAIDLPPPFWAFCWPGGAGLARHLLEEPELVRGASVLDIASGGGVVGIAAKLAGAARVLCVDVDPVARTAALLNAKLNHVDVDAESGDATLTSTDLIDVILAGDVFYDRQMTAALLPWLLEQASRGKLVLLGDPYRHYRPAANAMALAEYEVPVFGDIEKAQSSRVSVLQLVT